MALDLVNYEKKAVEAVQAFWGNREKAYKKQIEIGKIDAGERGNVTAGKNMDGFVSLIVDIIKANGLAHADILQARRVVTLPGYFPQSRAAVRDASPHFPVLPEFKKASYLERYNILCQKLTQEQLYTAASIITSPRTAATTGEYEDLHPMTSLQLYHIPCWSYRIRSSEDSLDNLLQCHC